MTSSSSSQRSSFAEVGFALGNLVPALVLGAGTYALPLRFWGLDVPIVLLVVWLLGTSALSLFNPRFSRSALRAGALGLFVAGLVLFTLFALSLAFLSGIHGSFGDLGEVLMSLVLALVVPYTLVYPVIELLWLNSRTPVSNVSASGAQTPQQSEASPESSADGKRPEVGE